MALESKRPSRLKSASAGAAFLATLACGAVAKHEGLRLVSYQDVIGVWTVCFGETRGIRKGMLFTKGECNEMLVNRLDEFGREIEACVPVLRDEEKVSPKRYVAHLSLAYNIGSSAYCKSSVARLTNQGALLEACNYFKLWNKAGGVEWKGLTTRRAEEAAWCRA